MESHLTVGIEIIYAKKDPGISKLSKAIENKTGITLYQIDKRYVLESESVEVDEELLDIIEGLVFDLGIETTRLKLVFVDLKGNKIIESLSAVVEFKKEYDVELDEEIPVSLFGELLEFIRDYEESLDEEMSSVGKNTDSEESGTESATTTIEEVKAEESGLAAPKDDLSTDDDFFDDVDFESDGSEWARPEEDTDSSEIVGETTSEEKVSDDDIQTQFKILQDQLEDDLSKNEDVLDNNENGEFAQQTQEADPLLAKARELFEKKSYDALPKFDEITHKELQNSILDASYKINSAKEDTIRAIYNKLKSECETLENRLGDSILSSAQMKHNETLKLIDSNSLSNIEKEKRKLDNDYKQRQEQYVQMQIIELKRAYDAKYLENHRVNIRLESEKIKQISNDQKKQEIENFEKYKSEVVESQRKTIFEEVNLDEEIKKFEKVTEEQRESLRQQANEFKDQISSVTKEMSEENKALKKQLENMTSKLDIQKSTENQRIEATVGIKLADGSREAERREKELKEQVLELENQLTKERENVSHFKESLVQAKSEAKALNAITTQAETPYQIVPVAATGVVAQNTDNIDKKSSKTFTVLLSVLIAVVVVSMILTTYFNLSNQSDASTTTRSTEIIQNTTASTDKFETGEEYPYTTSSGERVTLVMDSENSGHYIDSKGEYHSVLIRE